ncbi:hypothetical protein [Clostridium sp.]|uniref:hypothetical protein n=1 Tax=Clostridium sp. TaxID=1506 RepID=UPI002605537C|nr:hypothetical protein [uncultured Clostridium sp.]
MKKVNLDNINSVIILKGDNVTAYRDPTAIYQDGIFRIFYTLVETEEDSNIYMYTAMSKSCDLINWTKPKKITPRDSSLNFSSPGNIIRNNGKWIICLQTYPRQNGEKYANGSARVWSMESDDLDNWNSPEVMKVKGNDVSIVNMGRMIDPYLIEDKDEKGKWWCFYKQNGVSISYSYNLRDWIYFGNGSSGENVCIIIKDNQYNLFHSPDNGIGLMKSKDLINWEKSQEQITLGQQEWEWAKGRLTAGFVLDCTEIEGIKKYLMFFHGTGPQDESVIFDTNACIGLAWSKDLINWQWPSI